MIIKHIRMIIGDIIGDILCLRRVDIRRGRRWLCPQIPNIIISRYWLGQRGI